MNFIKTFLPVAALALSGLANASTTTETNSVVVRFGDLNLNSQAGVAKLHKRIRNAAESVCDQLETRILGLQTVDLFLQDFDAAARVLELGDAAIAEEERDEEDECEDAGEKDDCPERHLRGTPRIMRRDRGGHPLLSIIR